MLKPPRVRPNACACWPPRFFERQQHRGGLAPPYCQSRYSPYLDHLQRPRAYPGIRCGHTSGYSAYAMFLRQKAPLGATAQNPQHTFHKSSAGNFVAYIGTRMIFQKGMNLRPFVDSSFKCNRKSTEKIPYLAYNWAFDNLSEACVPICQKRRSRA